MACMIVIWLQTSKIVGEVCEAVVVVLLDFDGAYWTLSGGLTVLEAFILVIIVKDWGEVANRLFWWS